jgi:hypothetical protein
MKVKDLQALLSLAPQDAEVSIVMKCELEDKKPYYTPKIKKDNPIKILYASVIKASFMRGLEGSDGNFEIVGGEL